MPACDGAAGAWGCRAVSAVGARRADAGAGNLDRQEVDRAQFLV
jgi:hypothetical protein